MSQEGSLTEFLLPVRIPEHDYLVRSLRNDFGKTCQVKRDVLSPGRMNWHTNIITHTTKVKILQSLAQFSKVKDVSIKEHVCLKARADLEMEKSGESVTICGERFRYYPATI